LALRHAKYYVKLDWLSCCLCSLFIRFSTTLIEYRVSGAGAMGVCR
jgi:hypothetical protein